MEHHYSWVNFSTKTGSSERQARLTPPPLPVSPPVVMSFPIKPPVAPLHYLGVTSRNLSRCPQQWERCCCCCCCCCWPSLGHLSDWISAVSRWAVAGSSRGHVTVRGLYCYPVITLWWIPGEHSWLPNQHCCWSMKVFTTRGPKRKTIIADIIHCWAPGPHNDHTVAAGPCVGMR